MRNCGMRMGCRDDHRHVGVDRRADRRGGQGRLFGCDHRRARWNTGASPRGVPAGRRQSALWLAGKGQRDAREFRAWWLRHAGIHGRPRTNRDRGRAALRSEEHTSELQSLMRISYAVFCLKKKKITVIYDKKRQIEKNTISIKPTSTHT